jgi:polyphenol oxidase
MVEVLQAEDLKNIAGTRHGFFTRKGGVSEGIYASLNNGLSSGDDLARVVENRRRVAEHFHLKSESLLVCHQIHSADVVTVTKVWEAMNNPQADAMVTKEKNIALGILTADCVPLLFADSAAGVIGAAHAGWRGALTGVIENTLDAMQKLGANKKSIRVVLGPCIWQNSYEVGPEFPAPFLAENSDFARFFKPAFKSDRTMFNLPGYVEAKLRAAGVQSIESSPADTLANEERFFSYRRATLVGQKRTGSLISVIVRMD